MAESVFMFPSLSLSALTCKAYMPSSARHHPSMEEKDDLPLVARNLKALIGGESVNSWAKRHKLTQTTVNRIRTGKMEPTVAFLQRVAEAVNAQGGHLEAWQLMVPGFDPRNAPVLLRAGSSEHRLYERIAAFQREEHPEGAGDKWINTQSNPLRRASDK